jgi:hypothetical protein
MTECGIFIRTMTEFSRFDNVQTLPQSRAGLWKFRL